MKSRIWRLAGVGLLCVGISAQALADDPENRSPNGGGRGPDHQGNHQGHGGNNQPRPQDNPIIRGDNSRQFEHNGQQPNGQQHNNGQWQNQPHKQNQPRPALDNSPVRSPPPPPQLPANDLPISPRPDAVRQTQQPRQGYYRDERPQNGYNNQQWQTGTRPGYNNRPNDNRWPGRPDGHGNGWGPGPQYRPGHVIDRFPDRDYRVPYRGQDYYFSGGYWYRPQGPRYVVVQPPRGIRVQYLPDYSREVWIGGSLLFLAAGSYYAYQESTQDYVVVEPPVEQPQQPASNGYDVVAYPANGQSPEQVERDGYECYQYAVQQSGFNPRTATYQPAPEVVQAYRQAQGNCLASRGYRVE
ncbi:glycine zipper family protein [Pseudomonas syringae]|nr:glycine zipper family protein [Pseudomonas syringae]MCF5071145.1 glycine zipper family protein [Pseudomonas syringae]